MMRGGKTLVCVLSSLVLSTGSKALVADTPGKPYDGIVERNLFNLRQPVVTPPPEPPKPQPPKLMLTSITTILGKKLVTLSVAPRPGQPAQNLMLAEGQGQEGIDVMKIDENAQTVTVKNNGIEQTLDFINNAAKPTGPVPGAPIPVPGGLPVPPPTSGRPVVPGQSIPVRDIRGQPTPAMPAPPPAAVTPMSKTYTPAKPTLTPEEQVIMIEAQRMHYQDQGDPIANIFPPTELTPEAPQ